MRREVLVPARPVAALAIVLAANVMIGTNEANASPGIDPAVEPIIGADVDRAHDPDVDRTHDRNVDRTHDPNVDRTHDPDVDSPGLAGAGQHFRLFDAMLYRDMPSIAERVAVVYESTFYPEGRARDDDTPTAAGIAAAVADVRAQRGPPWHAGNSLVVVDIERWPVWPFAEGEAHARAVRRYGRTLERFTAALARDAAGKRARTPPVCLYGILPEAGPNVAVQVRDDAALRRAWRAAGEVTMKALRQHVDALCPALYSYYDAGEADAHRQRIEEWRTFARETIAESRRLAPDVPVYPFLWPQFHAGGNIADHPFLPDDYWRAELETVRELADGAILWGGWDFRRDAQLAWDPDAAWLRTLRRTLEPRP